MTIKTLAKLLGAAAVVLMLAACVTDPESGIITPGFPTTVPIESVALSQEQESAPTAAPEPTPETESTENLSIGTTMAMEEILAIELGFNTIDLAVEITNELETVVPGQQVIYKITVTNNNWNAAYGVRVTVELPSGISHDSDTAVCDQQVDGRLFCNPGYLEAYKSRELLGAVVVDSGLQADVDLTTNVSVEKINVHSRGYFPDLQVWPDPVPENNSAANTMRLTLLEGGQEKGLRPVPWITNTQVHPSRDPRGRARNRYR